jgi:hypothetical protein
MPAHTPGVFAYDKFSIMNRLNVPHNQGQLKVRVESDEFLVVITLF